jgi:hypothetical protein
MRNGGRSPARNGTRENFFTIFVDAIFTIFLERLFTNVFEVIGAKSANCCVCRARHAG